MSQEGNKKSSLLLSARTPRPILSRHPLRSRGLGGHFGVEIEKLWLFIIKWDNYPTWAKMGVMSNHQPPSCTPFQGALLSVFFEKAVAKP